MFSKNKNNDLNLLNIWIFEYFLFMLYLCLLGSWHNSVVFSFGVFLLVIFMAKWTFAFLGLEMRPFGWGVWDLVGIGRYDATTMPMTLFSCLCYFVWICFVLSSVVSVFGFGHVEFCESLFVVNTYFYIFYSSFGLG